MKRKVEERLSILTIICVYTLLVGITWSLNSWLAPAKPHLEPRSMRPTTSAYEQVTRAAITRHWNYRQLECLVALLNVENPTWNPRDLNPASKASGIFQVEPSPSGHLFRDYRVADQARLGTKYIAKRYGTPCKALKFERLHNYY